METQQEQQAANVLARSRMTEEQVQTAIVEYLLKDDELKNVIYDKSHSTCLPSSPAYARPIRHPGAAG